MKLNNQSIYIHKLTYEIITNSIILIFVKKKNNLKVNKII